MDKNNIPEMNLNNNSTNQVAEQIDAAQKQKDMEKTKKELEKLKNFICKKYKYTKAIGILPQQSIKFFVEEEEVPKESESNVHLYMVIPDEKYKETPVIIQSIVTEIEKMKFSQKVWVQVKCAADIWEACSDGKFEITSAIAMSYPLHDDGLLAGLRVAEIHKSLVLQKFEKYVVSYVIAGSLVRGDANETSDVDVFIIINDTDVKRMSRIELKERLRGIIMNYIGEASAMAGVDANKLNVQPYLLTDFWEAVKDAHPVMFTFIRDGVPLYDRGTFMPWKALLKMGKLKPSPEAIDMFMKSGEKTRESMDRRFLDAMVEIYWSVLTPSQAMLMLQGEAPPTPKTTVSEMKRVFFTNNKMLEAKYIKFLEKIIGLYKDYEHQKIKTVPGKEIDKLLQESEEYFNRLKELRGQIEKGLSEKTIEDVYQNLISLLKNTLGNKSQDKLILAFEKDLVKSGKFTSTHLKALNNIIKARNDLKKAKSNANIAKANRARKEATLLINDLVEYSQRIDLAALERSRMTLSYDNGKNCELLITKDCAYLMVENIVKKISEKGVSDSDMTEISKAAEEVPNKEIKVNPKYFSLIEGVIGKFEILL